MADVFISTVAAHAIDLTLSLNDGKPTVTEYVPVRLRGRDEKEGYVCGVAAVHTFDTLSLARQWRNRRFSEIKRKPPTKY